MQSSLSQASVSVFEIGLNALSGVLDKAEAFATAKKIDPTVLLNTRLSPDMFNLTRQVQVADRSGASAVRRASPAQSRRATRTTRPPSINSRRAWPRRSPI